MNNMLNIHEMAKISVDKAMKDQGLRAFDNMQPQALQEVIDDSAVEILKNIIENNGSVNYISDVYNSGKKIKFKDELMTSVNFVNLIPKVITKIVVEAAEPVLVLADLFDEIRADGISLVAPVVSGFGQDLDIPEGAEPPSFTVSTGGVKLGTMGKSGITIKLTDEAYEALDHSIFKYVLRQAGLALARHKEYKAYKVIDHFATLYDTGGTGVNTSGTENDSLTFDDILGAATQIYAAGGIPDTIIMNVLAAPIFMQNPTLRSMFLATSGNFGDFYGSGVSVNRKVNPSALVSAQGPAYTKVSFPTNIFGRGLNIILSSAVDYTPASSPTVPAKTNVYVADSSMIGFNVVKQRPMTEKWEDPARDIKNFKITERYALIPKYVKELDEKTPYIQKIADVAIVKGFDPDFINIFSA